MFSAGHAATIRSVDDSDYKAYIERMDRRADERERRFLERMQRSEQHFIDALAENSAEIRRLSEGYEEGREALRADTRAVLSILERLDGLDGGAAA